MYDCIWVGWVLMYIRDQDVLDFLARARLALAPQNAGRSGLLFLKENVGDYERVGNEFAITRTTERLMELFAISDLEVVFYRL